jgi:nanoRNase/pAp phosphatase (c-di-AMP/oligoRNAs hydrolase)/predicted transcriptional regulator
MTDFVDPSSSSSSNEIISNSRERQEKRKHQNYYHDVRRRPIIPWISSLVFALCNIDTLSDAFNARPVSYHHQPPSSSSYNQKQQHKQHGSSRTRITTTELFSEIDGIGSSSSSSSSQSPDDSSSYQQAQRPFGTYSARFLEDNGLQITTDDEGYTTATPVVDEEEEELDYEEDDDDDEDEYYDDDFEDFDYSFLKDDVLLDDTTNNKMNSEGTTTILKGEPQQEENSATTNAKSTNKSQSRPSLKEQPVQLQPLKGFNVVLTHCTADFDSLASAVGLAKLWSSQQTSNGSSSDDSNKKDDKKKKKDKEFDSSDSKNFPTFVVLPRGAHPSVQRFLALHKHLFPIRSLKSLPPDLSKLNRLGLVDAQRRDRIGPAEHLLEHANRVVVVDHHVDMESDIPETTDYVVDEVGSVSTLIAESLKKQQEEQQKLAETNPDIVPLALTEAEATLLALGIHADTGSLCFDSTTPRDAKMLAWVMEQGASQVAIAEHAHSSLSQEQQGVLTQALINTNSTVAHGVTISTVLLTAEGFINGLAAVTQDALELSSSDVYLLGLVYEPKAGGAGRKKKNQPGERIKSKLLMGASSNANINGSMMQQTPSQINVDTEEDDDTRLMQRLRIEFDRKDLDGSGCLNKKELSAALAASGIVVTEDTIDGLMSTMDKNQDGRVDFEEFVAFAKDVQDSIQKRQEEEQNNLSSSSESKSTQAIATSPPSTLIIIGRAKPGVNMKAVKLGKLLEKYGGGGHPKAASATVRLNDESEAAGILSGLVDELIETSLQAQPTVGEFMTSPVLSVKPDMTEKQVEDLFTRYDVRALPVVNEDNDVIGLVTYKEVAAAKQRMWNKEQKRMQNEVKKQQQQKKDSNEKDVDTDAEEKRKLAEERRKKSSTVKAWMKQHITTVDASRTMAEVEAILLGNDVGCIPVVQDGTMQLVGMVTRTDLLRQHRYYPSLHYNNKGMSDSIAARKPIIALRKKLKQFDLDE